LIKQASQDELRDYFAYFGSIKDARIITDTVGNSKGYGFVTYENESDAMKVLAQREQDFIFKESKLNIGQAFRQNNQNNQNNFNRQNNGGFGGQQGGFGGQQMNGGGFGGGFQQRQQRNPRFN
jgi:RNA recognition motif-containing protein